MTATEIVEKQYPLIQSIQYKIVQAKSDLMQAEQALAKTQEALKVQEMRTTLQAYTEQELTIREGIKQSMIAGHVKNLETDTHKFTIKNNPGSVVIVDDHMIPSEYKKEKMTITVDKTAIKEALKNGEEIHGAHMSYSQTLLITPK